MQTGRRGRADRMMVWLAAVLLCVLAGHASAQRGVEADREVLEFLSNNQPGTSSTLFVPVILTASGRNNSFFTSELTLTNRGDREARLEYTYTADRGGGSGRGSDRIAPGQQKIEPDAMAYLRRLGIPIPPSGNRLGTLRVEVAGSSDLAVSVRTTTLVPEGRAGLAYPGIATSDGFEEAVYLCGLRQNGQDRSNVAVQNAGGAGEESITLRVTVFSGDPASAGRRTVLPDRTLTPGGFHQYDGILKEAGFDNGYVKVERVKGTAPFYAYGVINDQANSDGSFVFPVTASSLEGVAGQTLPVIVENQRFTSELMVTNFSDVPKTVTFRFRAEAVQTPDKTAAAEWTLQAGQQVFIPDIVEVMRQRGAPGIGPSGQTFAGALFATVPNGDMSGIVIGARTGSSDGLGGQYGVFYHAVPDGAAFTKSVWVDGLQQNAENRSNLALVNTGIVDDSPSVFQLDIYDGTTGMLVNSVTGLKVTARGWRQINGILGKYAPGTTHGYVRISKISGNNPFLAYGVINDGKAPGQRSGDGAYLPATEMIHDPGTEELTEREVLEALYHATGGPNWRNRSNWLSAAPLSEWEGVFTDGNGRVTSLELGGHNLSGRIPAELSGLTHLQKLHLQVNELSGTIPPALGQLARLERIDLAANELSGRIPPQLGRLAHLQRLALHGNNLSGGIPAELGGLTHLQELSLAINDLSGAIPLELGGLTRLRWLNLSSNRLSGEIPAELGRMTSLQTLGLSHNRLSGAIPTELGRLAYLQKLILSGNELSGGVPAELGGLTRLQQLSLRQNELNGGIPNNLQQLSGLTWFDIRDTDICVPTDAAFQAWLGTIPTFLSSELVCDGTKRVFFSASSYDVKEGESVAVSVRLIDQTEYPVPSVAIALSATPGGGATATDYSGIPESVTIMAPANEGTFVVAAVKDDHFDHSETVVLRFRRPLPTGVIAGTPETATVTIHDPGNEGVTDREVLEALYHATGGSAWTNRTNWLSNMPLSEWYGVTTDGRGQVTALSLFSNGLSGTLPPALGQLTYLQRLHLQINRLSGVIPPELAGLASLQELNLAHNVLNGEIPVELGGLSQLQRLGLGLNQLSGRIPPELAGLTELLELDLGNNRLTGEFPVELGGLTLLQVLDLGGNQLTGGIPLELAGLTHLRELKLGFNELSGEIPFELGGLTLLEKLNLRSNQLTGGIPLELAALTDLLELGLGGNRLSGGIPSELGRLTFLRGLNLAHNQLSEGIPAELGGLTHLQWLYLGHNRLSGGIPAELGGLTRLRWLLLGGNDLSGGIPPELGGLSQLLELDLGHNQLSGGIPPELGGLTDLRSLLLGGNDLSGGIPPELGELSQLLELNLGHNQLSGGIPSELNRLTTLKVLDLGFNGNLSGAIPTELQHLPLSTLDLMATSVCVPENVELQDWLATIDFVSSGLTCGHPADAMSSIDILVVYTPTARKIAGGAAEIEAHIDLMIAETNQAYLDSGVNQRVVLVARQEVEYTDSGSSERDLDRLASPSDGYMDEVHAIRDQAGADLVHLIGVGFKGGLAHVMTAFAYTCADECDSSVFAHELGHNMGLHHDRYVTPSSQTFPYSHGYVNQRAFANRVPESVRWITIMAYPNQCSDAGLRCNKIMRFSNPNQTHLGDPLGVPGTDRTSAVNGPADAVRTLNITRHSVANWRPRASGNRLTMSSTLSQARSMFGIGGAVALLPGDGLFSAIAPNRGGAVSRRAGGALDRATLRRRQASIDIGKLARVPAGGITALRLNLFDDVVLTGIIERWTPTYSGGFALSGRLAGVPGGAVTLVVNGNVVAGTVRIPGAIFRIRPGGSGRHAITQVDPSQLPQGCKTETVIPGQAR